jgi:hypothetical protein
MKATVKSMWVNSAVVSLDAYHPVDSQNFSLWIELRVGLEGSTGGDDYRVLVCTPEWLRQNISEPRWGRHMLIVQTYDRSAIEKCVRDYIAECSGVEWSVIAKKIARNLSWEFEDYQN